MRRLHLEVAVSVSLIAGLIAMAAPAADAAPAWKITPSPNRAGFAENYLNDVACPTSTSCFAVGSVDGGLAGKSATLIERWNGAKWSLVTSPDPNPKGAHGFELFAIDCVSATNCFAVGGYLTAAGGKTLVKRWNGAKWSVVASPNPTGGAAGLSGIDCVSATNCFAVGAYGQDAPKTLVERWNGTKWSIVASPNKANVPSGTGSTLGGVSCASANNCVAVGAGGSGTLALRWNGTKWSIVASPSPPSPSLSILADVSCTSATSCVAVGASVGSSFKTLTERWNGAKWSIVASPNPTGPAGLPPLSLLTSVSCASATNCLAVGSFFGGLGSKPLVERWNGAKWSIVAGPEKRGAVDSSLWGVSCRTTASCTAVGEYSTDVDTFTLAARYA